MDRSLQNLLTSSGAVSPEADRSLAEIARAVLVDRPGESKRSVREKAGLLALLNLLGIVDAFYADASAEAEPQASSAPPSTRSEPENPPSPLSALTRLISSASPADTGSDSQAAHPGISPSAGSPLSSLLGSLDPALLASMVGLVSSIARARTPRQPESGETALGARAAASDAEAAEDTAASQPSSGQPDSPSASVETTEGSATPRASPPASGQPSPLQQVLGLDPRILTLALNLLAELMKSRTGEQRPVEQAKQREAPAGETVSAVMKERSAGTPGMRKPSLGPRLYHKPGFGIYRSPNLPHHVKARSDRPGEA